MTARRLITKQANGGPVNGANGKHANGANGKHANGSGRHGGQANRFYPESVPPFTHEPTRDRFAIRAISKDCGEGVVALRPFKKGEVVFVFTGFYAGEITLFSLQVKPGLYLHDPFFMGKILHRCDPNCDVDMERRVFTARRDIGQGEWVTMNYEQTEDQLYRPFACSCGDTPCAGYEPHRVIRGRTVNGTTEGVLAAALAAKPVRRTGARPRAR